MSDIVEKLNNCESLMDMDMTMTKSGGIFKEAAGTIAALRAENARLRWALERAEFWFKARLTGNAVGGSTSERLEDIRAALAEKGE